MRCDESRKLFDAYLDGELVGALATDFAAHRVRCAPCRRDLAILEVTGHVLATDGEPVAAPDDFTDRLLACMDARSRSLTHRVVRWAYIAGPLAAAAVITLAFLGVFDRKQAEVAGRKDVRMERNDPASAKATPSGAADFNNPLQSPESQREAARSSNAWMERTRRNLAVKQQSAESIGEALDAAAERWISILDQANSGVVDDASPVDSDLPPAAKSTPKASGGNRPDAP